ncbi:hypothetical protein BB561_005932 [Smittium simulii]|uniref:SIS domain-containing protein n=1 Tax=Smittium simulii TaxID=133385 RepID=A0A2T9Y7I4_9FUNG|nr:hypothetical protein BB561_005932 [Smittium simulii]
MSFSTPQNTLLGARSALSQLQKLSQSILACSDKIASDPLPFQNALSILYKASTTRGSKVIITAVGKSAKIGEKLVATLVSTGTLAVMMHSTEALHGDLGLVRPGDVIIAISYSGNTDEVVYAVEQIIKKRNKIPPKPSISAFLCDDKTTCVSPASKSETSSCIDFSSSPGFSDDLTDFSSDFNFTSKFYDNLDIPIISLCGNPSSKLAQLSDVWLDVSVDSEASLDVPAPTISTTVTLAMGDALAMSLMDMINFKHSDFVESHPGGSLGKTTPVSSHKNTLVDNSHQLFQTRSQDKSLNGLQDLFDFQLSIKNSS